MNNRFNNILIEIFFRNPVGLKIEPKSDSPRLRSKVYLKK